MNAPNPLAFLKDANQRRTERTAKLATLEQEIEDAVAVQRKAGDFAPMSDPERMKMVGKLAGQTIREAYATTATQIQAATDEVIKMVVAIKADGEDFVAQLNQIGEQHAARVEDAISHLHGILVTFSQERGRLSETPAIGQPQSAEAAPAATPPSGPGTDQ